MRRLSKAVAVRCCCCCVIVCGTLHVARVMRCYCCCCSRHNVAHTQVITTKILGDKKKGEQAQQKKDTLHTRLTTHARCTLHAQWAHLIVFVIARCCYCCWYYCCCYCCCCYVALCCTRRGEGTHDGKAREKCSKTRLVRAVG